MEYGKRARWDSIEWRCREQLLPDRPESCTFLGHVLDLTPGEEKLFSGLRDSTKRNIKKAKKESVEFVISKELSGMKEFYRLNCLTRGEHGLPPQPNYFFCRLQEDIVQRDQGFIALAFHNGRCISGGTENTIYYYDCNLKKEKYLSNKLWIEGFHNQIFNRMPISLLRVIGSVMYRHVA